MNRVKELLVDAKSLIATPEQWVQQYFALIKENGQRCYCADGALSMAAFNDPFQSPASLDESEEAKTYWSARDLLAESNVTGSVWSYNDSAFREHGDILAWFDKAIAKADALVVD